MLAQRFHVSVGWARKVSATYRRSGSWARPPSCPRGPRSKFTVEIRRQVGEWMAEQPDLTLHELQSRLHEELRLRASIGRLWSLLREMGLRLKKNALRRRARHCRQPTAAHGVAAASKADRPGKVDFLRRKQCGYGNDSTLRTCAARPPRAGRRAGEALANVERVGGDSLFGMAGSHDHRGADGRRDLPRLLAVGAGPTTRTGRRRGDGQSGGP